MLKKTFNKKERLNGKLSVNRLFNSGTSFFLHPFLVYYSPGDPSSDHHRLLVTVSKKHFKRAVHRNLIKRRIREAYRLNKSGFSLNAGKHYDIGLVYISKEIHSFEFIQSRLKKIPAKLKASNA